MIVRIVIAAVLLLAAVPAWAEEISSAEDFERVRGELAPLLEQMQTEMLDSISDGASRAFEVNSVLDDDARTTLCESYRFGLRTLEEVLNGSLAQVQTTAVTLQRKQVALFLALAFPAGLVGDVDRGDVGWGEGCNLDFELCESTDAESTDAILTMFEMWEDTLRNLGMFVALERVSRAQGAGEHARKELCGVPPDE